MMITNVPAVYLGEYCGQRIPIRWVRGTAALLFALFGVVVLAGIL